MRKEGGVFLRMRAAQRGREGSQTIQTDFMPFLIWINGVNQLGPQ